ncbi:MAG: ATP-binding cassette domain-containing protein [Gammaproteobacteria bacterium]|nr:ATP-binding cassette domain-containing protein [Gammaproteobacteria bacterium]
MATHPILRAGNITKTYGSLTALDNVSLEVEPGIVYGLLGPNGAGKTTLIRVMTTLIRPDSGSAEIAGIDVLSDPRTARTHMGLAGQFAAVDSYLTGRENVEMVGRLYNLPKAEARQRAADVLERIHLDDDADRPVRTYSGGMKRRLDLAASMVGRPQVLFLDEPTSGIDPGSRIDLWDLIKELVDDGTTILLTTQYLDEADQLADRVGVIDHGRLITEGTPAALKESMGGAVVEVTVADHHREETLAALASVNGHRPTFEPKSNKILVPATHGPATLTDTVRVLDQINVIPEDIALRRPTLDDVFLELTGHTAQHEEKNGGHTRRPARRNR